MNKEKVAGDVETHQEKERRRLPTTELGNVNRVYGGDTSESGFW
jgi:hypothetical protein